MDHQAAKPPQEPHLQVARMWKSPSGISQMTVYLLICALELIPILLQGEVSWVS